MIVDETEGISYFLLKNGPYLSAGRHYGWNGPGLGLNEEILKFTVEMGVNVRIFVEPKRDRCYEADPLVWLQESRKRRSLQRRGSVLIRILPWTREFFTTVRGDFKEVIATLGGG
ncbi:MAG: hypothetical protein ACE5Z5_14725 [Candidatus Bathyarchaeia archaeon]